MFRTHGLIGLLAAAAILAAAPAAATAQKAEDPPASNDPGEAHIRIYKKIAPSVVFVRGGLQKGSGVVIDGDGYILTSPTACGESTEDVTVMASGRRKLAGKVVGRVNELELVIVKVAEKFPAVELGDSAAAKIGSVTYVFGDSFGSIEIDDAPAMSLGVLSAAYELTGKQKGSRYAGMVLETSCAVNPHQDGGPLVDARGRLLGIVSFNYHDSKFAGVAVPINRLKPEIERIIKDHREGKPKPPPDARKGRPGWLGADVRAGDGGLAVAKVYAKGPAEKSGLKVGDVVLKVDGQSVERLDRFQEILGKFEEGAGVTFRVKRGEEEVDVTVTLGKRVDY